MAGSSFGRWVVVLGSGLVLAACSGHTASSAANDAGSGSSGLQVGIGPIDVPAGVETTQCVVVALGNTEDLVVDSFDVTLSEGSHHLILYITPDMPASDPVNCTPFVDLVTGSDTPLVFVNKKQENFTFPTGIATVIPANSNIKVEGHYINTTAQDLQGTGLATLHATPASAAPAYQPADFVFYGTLHINIPPNSSYSTGPLFQAGPAGTHYISVSTHQHRLGTQAQVWTSAQPGDMSTQVADDKDWSNPSWNLINPEFAFDGTSGLTYQCDWTNTTDQTVGFGESALDEMCFIGGYYYPSTKLDLCIDGHCKNR